MLDLERIFGKKEEAFFFFVGMHCIHAIYTHLCVCVCVCVCLYILYYIYIHRHTHTNVLG